MENTMLPRRSAEIYERRINNRVPLVGRWLRFRAVDAIASECDPECIRVFVDTAETHWDERVRNYAKRLLRGVTNCDVVDAICAYWVDHRSSFLTEVVVQIRYVSRQAVHLALLASLKAGDVRVAESAPLASLINACHDTDSEISERALSALNQVATAERIRDAGPMVLLDQDVEILSAILAAHDEVGVAPVEVRVLSALKLHRLNLLANGDSVRHGGGSRLHREGLQLQFRLPEPRRRGRQLLCVGCACGRC